MVKNPFASTCLPFVHSYGPEVFYFFYIFFLVYPWIFENIFLIWQPKPQIKQIIHLSSVILNHFIFFTSHKNMIIRSISFWSSAAGCGLKKDFILGFWDRFYDHKWKQLDAKIDCMLTHGPLLHFIYWLTSPTTYIETKWFCKSKYAAVVQRDSNSFLCRLVENTLQEGQLMFPILFISHLIRITRHGCVCHHMNRRRKKENKQKITGKINGCSKTAHKNQRLYKLLESVLITFGIWDILTNNSHKHFWLKIDEYHLTHYQLSCTDLS